MHLLLFSAAWTLVHAAPFDTEASVKYPLTIAALVALALCLFCAMPVYAEGSNPPGYPPAKLTGHISFGGGTEGLRLSGDRATSLGVEVKLRLKNALGPVSLNAACRHFLDNDESFWRGKSKLNLGFDVPLGPGAAFFLDHERKYYGGEAWSWCGVRLAFGG
jgi:hypothetical protein